MGISPITNLAPLPISRAIEKELEPLPMERVESSSRTGTKPILPAMGVRLAAPKTMEPAKMGPRKRWLRKTQPGKASPTRPSRKKNSRIWPAKTAHNRFWTPPTSIQHRESAFWRRLCLILPMAVLRISARIDLCRLTPESFPKNPRSSPNNFAFCDIVARRSCVFSNVI